MTDHLTRPLVIAFVAGARPNYPKIAPILSALKGHDGVQALLVDAGQHYDRELVEVFFEDLSIDRPDWQLGVGSGSHAVQTGRIMVEFEKRCLDERPDAIVVVGDVNSTMACALVGAKLHIPVAHVEAGLRSGDRSMPEEINRLVTDGIADLLYTHCEDANDNLAREGVAAGTVQMVGNVLIDTLLNFRERAERPWDIAPELLQPGGFGVVTLHRPALVDHADRLGPILDALVETSRRLPSRAVRARCRTVAAFSALASSTETIAPIRLRARPTRSSSALPIQSQAVKSASSPSPPGARSAPRQLSS